MLLLFIAHLCCLCPGKYCDMAFEVRLLVFQFRGGLVRICKGVKKMVEDNIQRGQDVKISSSSLPRFAGICRWRCKVFYGSHWSHLLADYIVLWAIEHPDLKHIAHIKFLMDFSDGGKGRKWAEAEIERTRESCDFCKPYQFTVTLSI